MKVKKQKPKKKKSPRPISKNLKAGDLMWLWMSKDSEPSLVMVLEDFKYIIDQFGSVFNNYVFILDGEKKKSIHRNILSKNKRSCRKFDESGHSFQVLRSLSPSTVTSATQITAINTHVTTLTSNTLEVNKFATLGNTTTLLANNHETANKV